MSKRNYPEFRRELQRADRGCMYVSSDAETPPQRWQTIHMLFFFFGLVVLCFVFLKSEYKIFVMD